MAKSLHPERETQNRIVKFFEKELGYKYLGNLEAEANFNVRWGDWKKFLSDSGYSAPFVESLQNEFFKTLNDFSKSFLLLTHAISSTSIALSGKCLSNTY